MASCLEYKGQETSSSGEVFEVYYAQLRDVATCNSIPDTQIVMDNTEYQGLINNAAESFLTALIDPSYLSTADYELIFMFGFTTPLFAYFVAWGYQTVISFMTKY